MELCYYFKVKIVFEKKDQFKRKETKKSIPKFIRDPIYLPYPPWRQRRVMIAFNYSVTFVCYFISFQNVDITPLVSLFKSFLKKINHKKSTKEYKENQ